MEIGALRIFKHCGQTYKMRFNKIFLGFIFFFSLNSFSQKIFEENGNRKYSDTLNIELLHNVCDNLGIKFSNVLINKSQSISFSSDKTFYALQYIIKNTEDENLYTTKYLFVENSDGQVIDHIDDKDSYFLEEAVQPSPSYILKNKIKLSNDIIGVGIITEESVRSCATLYSQQKISIISLSNNKIMTLLDGYPIRRTQGESNCSGNYEVEILEKSIDLMKSKTNGLFNLLVTKIFTYENVVESNEDKKIKGQKIVNSKTETERLIFNGTSYDFK